MRFGFIERLAATYSRGIYKTTTIGKTVFDGRVRNGIGSDHTITYRARGSGSCAYSGLESYPIKAIRWSKRVRVDHDHAVWQHRAPQGGPVGALEVRGVSGLVVTARSERSK